MLQGWTKIFLYCHHEPSENQEISSTVVLILKQFSAINELSYPRQFYSYLSQISFCFQAGKHCSLWKEENKKFVMRKEIRTPLNLGKTLSFLPSTPCLLPIKYNNSVFSWQSCFFKTHTHSSVWGRRDHWGHGEARGCWRQWSAPNSPVFMLVTYLWEKTRNIFSGNSSWYSRLGRRKTKAQTKNSVWRREWKKIKAMKKEE